MTIKTLLFAGAAAALSSAVLADAVVPGEFTDPTNVRKLTDDQQGWWYVAPDHLKYPYISTYYITPTVKTGEKVTIPFFVTDYDNSKIRFGDESFRFTVKFKCLGADGKVREETLANVPSGDGAFEFAPFPEGEYEFCVWAVDAKGIESHRVWHKFRVMTPEALEILPRETYAMAADDLETYGIRNDGDLGRRVLVDAPSLEDYEPQATPRDGSPGYTVFIPAPGGKIPAGACRRSKIVYDEGYDTNAVEQAAIATAEGLQKLLDDKAAAGFRKVVLLPGTYRISAFRKVKIPDRMTLDLNGATLKENAFTGAGALMVSLSNVYDAHLVNGTLEGDYYEHDYENSPSNSEWPTGFGISGKALYCSVENVTVKDITGYGGGNGMGKFNDKQVTFLKGAGRYLPGGLNIKDGTVDAAEEGRFTTDFIKLPPEADRLQVSAYLGYQGIRSRQWQLAACWYDKDKNFLCGETLWQYRVVPRPKDAMFLRFSQVNVSAKAAGKDDLSLTCFFIPQNCAVKNCTFDRCRCVGYAASAMKNMLFENNFFTHSGEAAAKCAFDAEDGWDMMQDVTFRGNRCKDNPFNSRLLTCAGHNFVFERNKCGIYLWPRTNSPCVRDNEMDTATMMCETRNRSGYGRFERNVYTGSVSLRGGKSWSGWDFALAGLDLDGHGKTSFAFGPSSRIRECSFSNAEVVSPAIVTASKFSNCTVSKPGFGRWYGVEMAGGAMEAPSASNLFHKCSFRDVAIRKVGDKGLQLFTECTFENCRVDGLSGSTVVFSNCVFKGGATRGLEGDSPASVEFLQCRFEMSGMPAVGFSACGIRDVTFAGCEIAGDVGEAAAFVDIFDLKPKAEDVKGTMTFAECRFGAGVKSAVCVAKAVQGDTKRKQLEFVFKANKFTEKGVTPVRDRLPHWVVTRIRKNGR